MPKAGSTRRGKPKLRAVTGAPAAANAAKQAAQESARKERENYVPFPRKREIAFRHEGEGILRGNVLSYDRETDNYRVETRSGRILTVSATKVTTKVTAKQQPDTGEKPRIA